MYLKTSLVERLSLVTTEAYQVVNVSDDDTTEITSTDPVFSSSTEVSTDSTTSSSGTTDITSPGGDDETSNKWVLPLVISLGCILFIVAIAATVVIYRKWRCFGLPLPCFQRKMRFAQPIKKLANSVRSSISSTFSSSAGSIRGGDNNKQFRKYAVRLDQKVKEGSNNAGNTVDGRDLGWIEGKDFSAEFEAMRRADLKDIPVTAALKLENVLRNRFSNVLPYDRTRVVLTSDGTSGNDYVNASYISGHRKEKEFICTQGPLKHTVADFWRMCWETRAVAIVMLTKCYENNLEKCYPYWPSSSTGSSTFADIKVTLEKKTTWKLQSCQDPDPETIISQKDHLWQVSELTMEREGESCTHSIVHIVFLSWPDFGVVDPPSSLVSFVRNVREAVESFENNNDNGKKTGPIVVHCSAGVGRSGVFIAVDKLIQEWGELTKEEDNLPTTVDKSVNIFQTVAHMRRERMGMVQNLQQYTLIYKCLQVLVNKRKGEEPSMVSNDAIKGSDWGLIYPDASNS